MEGFLELRFPGWRRRLLTRSLAIVPAAVVAAFYGPTGIGQLILLSQAILSMQLSFAVFPLVAFTSNQSKMGRFANGWLLRVSSYGAAMVIAGLNIWLLLQILWGHS